MMAVIQDTLEVCSARGRSVDLPHLPKEDEAHLRGDARE